MCQLAGMNKSSIASLSPAFSLSLPLSSPRLSPSLSLSLAFAKSILVFDEFFVFFLILFYVGLEKEEVTKADWYTYDRLLSCLYMHQNSNLLAMRQFAPVAISQNFNVLQPPLECKN